MFEMKNESSFIDIIFLSFVLFCHTSWHHDFSQLVTTPVTTSLAFGGVKPK